METPSFHKLVVGATLGVACGVGPTTEISAARNVDPTDGIGAARVVSPTGGSGSRGYGCPPIRTA